MYFVCKLPIKIGILKIFKIRWVDKLLLVLYFYFTYKMNQIIVFERSDASGSIQKLMGILHTKYIEMTIKLAIFKVCIFMGNLHIKYIENRYF